MKPSYLVKQGRKYLILEIAIAIEEVAFGEEDFTTKITKAYFTDNPEHATTFGHYPTKHVNYFKGEVVDRSSEVQAYNEKKENLL